MAEVFAATSIGAHGFSKPVAIKRLLPELARDHVFVDRLIGEAKLLVGMQHGNIVSVLDLAREGNDVFLVMEFVDGPSLRQLLRARELRGLPLGISTYIIKAAAAGLQFAHDRPGGAVIHADVSPSNVLLTTAGEVRVADFGIARREGAATGAVEGKWAYMAPEQARGEPLTPRSDVFALGVVLYEAITSRHPFARNAFPGDRGTQAVPPRAVNASVPPGLEQICMRALAADPRDRFTRMQDLIDALVDERYANGWREDASDLARIIRDHGLGGGASRRETVVTSEPLTIFTRSLIAPPPLVEPQNRPEPQTPAPAGFVQRKMHAQALSQLQGVRAMMEPVTVYEERSSSYGSAMSNGVTERRKGVGWAVSAVVVSALIGVMASFMIHRTPGDDRTTARATVTRQLPPSPSRAPAPPEPRNIAQPSPVIASPPPVASPPRPVASPPRVAAPVEHRPPAAGHDAPHVRASGDDAVLKIRTLRKIAAKITIASSDTKVHGEASNGSFTLRPGKYQVMLSNQDLDVFVDCGIRSVVAGKVTQIIVDMEENVCSMEH